MTDKKLSGAELIAQERKEQLKAHGFSLQHDMQYSNQELKSAAMYALTLDKTYYPASWDTWFMNKLDDKDRYEKPDIERLKIAGALIAAEIDRLQNL